MPCATSRPVRPGILMSRKARSGVERGDLLRRLDAVAGDVRRCRARARPSSAARAGRRRGAARRRRSGRSACATCSWRRPAATGGRGTPRGSAAPDVERRARCRRPARGAPDVGQRRAAPRAARRGARAAAARPAPSSSTVITSEPPSLRAPTRTRAAGDLRLEAVDDRVLDQRLQRQRRQGQRCAARPAPRSRSRAGLPCGS